MNTQTLTIETVSHARTVTGTVTRHHVAVEGIPTAYRVNRRRSDAYRAGLAFVKALDTPTTPSVVDGVPVTEPAPGVSYVAVLDSQRRVLAAWRRFDLGMTGTHDMHPMVGGRSPLWKRR